MLRSISLAALLAAPLALWSFAAPPAPPSAAACKLWMHEPLLAFDATHIP